jgi:hypothetical protein
VPFLPATLSFSVVPSCLTTPPHHHHHASLSPSHPILNTPSIFHPHHCLPALSLSSPFLLGPRLCVVPLLARRCDKRDNSPPLFACLGVSRVVTSTLRVLCSTHIHFSFSLSLSYPFYRCHHVLFRYLIVKDWPSGPRLACLQYGA